MRNYLFIFIFISGLLSKAHGQDLIAETNPDHFFREGIELMDKQTKKLWVVLTGVATVRSLLAVFSGGEPEEMLAKVGLPEDSLVLIEDTSHEAAVDFMRLRDSIDVLIPRGGPSLIRSILDNATVPYVIDGDGNCHVYVDATADLAMAADIAVNAKTQRPSVCNAAESLVVHRAVAADDLRRVAEMHPGEREQEVHAIAERADVSVRTVIRRFGSKEGVIAACIESTLKQDYPRFQIIAAPAQLFLHAGGQVLGDFALEPRTNCGVAKPGEQRVAAALVRPRRNRRLESRAARRVWIHVGGHFDAGYIKRDGDRFKYFAA